MQNNSISRRKFLRSAMMGTGGVLIYAITGNTLFAKVASNKYFSTIKGKSGCSHCEHEIAAMLKDKKKLAKLESLFPSNTKIYFYVRRHKKIKNNKGIHIAVGNCSHSIKKDADLLILGCGKRITRNSIFNAILKKFDKTDTAKYRILGNQRCLFIYFTNPTGV